MNKDYVVYKDKIHVYPDGRIVSFYHYVKGKTMKHVPTNNGYMRIKIGGRNGKRESVHRVLAICFIPNPENKPCVNHINGIKHDNRLENLEWCTYSENIIHAIKTGLTPTNRKNCRRGHLFTPESTYTQRDTGYRTCRICAKENQQRYRDAAKSNR